MALLLIIDGVQSSSFMELSIQCTWIYFVSSLMVHGATIRSGDQHDICLNSALVKNAGVAKTHSSNGQLAGGFAGGSEIPDVGSTLFAGAYSQLHEIIVTIVADVVAGATPSTSNEFITCLCCRTRAKMAMDTSPITIGSMMPSYSPRGARRPRRTTNEELLVLSILIALREANISAAGCGSTDPSIIFYS